MRPLFLSLTVLLLITLASAGSKKCSDICYLCRKKCGKGLVGHLSCACPYGTLCCVPPHKHPSPYKYPKYPPYKKV